MPKNTHFNYWEEISDLTPDNYFYLQLDSEVLNNDPFIDSVDKYLYGFEQLTDALTEGDFSTFGSGDKVLNLKVNVGWIVNGKVTYVDKQLNRQDKINILKKILMMINPGSRFSTIEIIPDPRGLDANYKKLYTLLYNDVYSINILYKPSIEVLNLIYLLSCFIHLTHLIYKNGDTDVDRIKTILGYEDSEGLGVDIHISDYLYITITKYYEDAFNLFTDENKQKFFNMIFIPKSHNNPKLKDWWNKYKRGDTGATCNAGARTAFYKLYRNYMGHFYPDVPLKDQSLSACNFRNVSDYLRGLGEIDRDLLTFELVENPVEIARFATLVATNYSGEAGRALVEREVLSQLAYQKKYLKYKAKYLNLKKNFKR